MLSETQIQWIITAIVGIAAVVGPILAAGARRTEAQTDKDRTTVDTALALIEPLQERVTALELELQREIKERRLMYRWALALRAQVIDSGVDPITFERIVQLEEGKDVT